MLNNKGQESAPFELLIAVIIMSFVIFVGLIAMGNLTEQKCYNETVAKLEEMKTKIETVVAERSPQQINFRLSACYNPEDEQVKIMDYSEPAFCADYCSATKNLCTLLQYYYAGANDTGGFAKRLCLNISPDADFPTTGGNCPPKEGEGYELVDFREEIVQGQYLLVNKTSVTSTFPTICAYRKTG
ncbi:MAG: hypothetical protein WC634_03730 [archaeon]